MTRAREVIRYASGTTGVNFEKWLTWGAIGALAYILYKALNVAGAAKEALASAGSAIGTGLYDVLHPNEIGETFFYTVTFPDATRRSIPSKVVSAQGIFRNDDSVYDKYSRYKGDGKVYRIMVLKSDRTKRIAVPA